MSQLMSGSLRAPLAGVIGVEQDTRAYGVIVSKYPGDAAINAPDVNAHAEFHFQQGYYIGEGGKPQTQPLAKLCCVLFSLCAHIPRKYLPFGRIVARPLDAEQALQLRL